MAIRVTIDDGSKNPKAGYIVDDCGDDTYIVKLFSSNKEVKVAKHLVVESENICGLEFEEISNKAQMAFINGEESIRLEKRQNGTFVCNDCPTTKSNSKEESVKLMIDRLKAIYKEDIADKKADIKYLNKMLKTLERLPNAN